ncbi:MAG: hypothetical protein U0996_22105 [Planctomycetaceae bacterium]
MVFYRVPELVGFLWKDSDDGDLQAMAFHERIENRRLNVLLTITSHVVKYAIPTSLKSSIESGKAQ